FTRAQVSAHPVVLELVIVGAGAERSATATRQSSGEQFITERRIARDVVVVYVHVHIQAVRQVRVENRDPQARWRIVGHKLSDRSKRTRGAFLIDNCESDGEFALADADAARERTSVVVNAIVGDLQVVRPSVDEHAAAALGAVPDGEPVNRRWVALK